MLLNRGISAYVFCGSAGISNAGSVKTQFDRLIIIAVILCPGRNPADGTFTNLPATFLFMRGYTGHEHYDKFGLINMNARLYDPFLGRFLSPDPQVQAPGYGQNYNRYTYALNNPLKYTDPDGEFVHLILGAMIGGYINLAMNAHKVDNFWQALGYFGIGAASGALSAGVGAGISSALAGGAFGAGFMGTQAARIAATSFISGSIVGAGAGATNGFVSGTFNSVMEGNNAAQSLSQGAKLAFKQGITGALIGGAIGGFDAIGNKRNFWTGKDQGSGRSLFAFNNSDKLDTHYRTKAGYEKIDNIERASEIWVDEYDDRVNWGTADEISNGAISRRDNYTFAGQEQTLDLSKFQGRTSLQVGLSLQEGQVVAIYFDNNLYMKFDQAKYSLFNEYIDVPAYVQTIRWEFIQSSVPPPIHTPLRVKISGFKKW